MMKNSLQRIRRDTPRAIEALESRRLLSGVASNAPTAELLSPVAGSLFSYAQLNKSHLLKVQFKTASAAGLNAQSILDATPEFSLSGPAAARVKVGGRPRQDASDPSVYVYRFTGSFNAGDVAVNFPAGSFADSMGTLNAAATEHFVAATSTLKGYATRNGQRKPVSIGRTDGGLIDPNATTWLLIHGRGDSPSGMVPVANALTSLGDQILTVNWSSGASFKNFYTDFTGQDWIKPVGVSSAEQLRAYGFADSELNIVGHSWGADVGDELAARLVADGLGKVQSIVALDPARGVPATLTLPGAEVLPSFGLPVLSPTITLKGGKTYNQDNPGEINFAAHARVSWAFRGSVLGSAISPSTAADAFAVNFPAASDPVTAHDAAVQLFVSLLLDHNPVTAYFSPSRLLGTVGGPDPWQPDQYSNTFAPVDTLLSPGADQAVYEARISATLDASGASHASELQYISTATGNEVDLLPAPT